MNVIENPKVSILVLNYNGWQDTKECLESIYNILFQNWELVLIDNGSEDDSVSKIENWVINKFPNNKDLFSKEIVFDGKEAPIKQEKEKKLYELFSYQKLTLLQIEKNRGITGALNIGIEYILREKKTDYILIMNNDIVVDKDFLTKLVEVGKNDENIGIVGPINYHYDQPQKFWVGSIGNIDFWRGTIKLKTEGELNNKIGEVDFITGSTYLISRKLFEKIGLLDREYIAYWEDTDFCIRANKAGYKVVYCTDAVIWHKVSSTVKKISGFYLYYMARNNFLFMKKHATKMQYISFISYFFLFRFWIRTSSILLRYKDPKGLITFYQGIKDGLGY